MKNLFKATYPMKCKSWGLLVLRLAAGIIFVVHGYGKLTGNPSVEMLAGMIQGIHFPFPMFFAWVVTLVEFFGGIALLVGFWVKPASLLLAIDMLVAFSFIKQVSLPKGDPDLALFAIVVALYLLGPGRFSIEGKMHKHGEMCKDGVCEPKMEMKKEESKKM